MNIYVGNLPKGTRPAEIMKLIKESFRGHIFQGLYARMLDLGRFEAGVAVDIHQQRGRRGHRYSKIHFRSERMGRVALEVMDGTQIRGMGLAVRAYVERQAENDRRRNNATSDSLWPYADRRHKSERRRH